jgi:pilus assembly protein CpaF
VTTYPSAPFEPPESVAGATTPQLNGHGRGSQPPDGDVLRQATGDEAAEAVEATVVRLIRRDVARKLTDATRAHDHATDRPLTEPERERLTHRLISDALDSHADSRMSAGHPPLHPQVESRVARTVADSLLGAGGLQPLLEDDTIEEITANGCDVVHVRHAGGRVEQVSPIADSDAELVDLVRVLAARGGAEERRWDRAAPMLNLQLADGSRLNAVLAVTRRPSLSIRRHRFMTLTLTELETLGTIDVALRELLTAAVAARLNMIVGGRTGAGKTTLLRGLASVIPPSERLLTIEDTYELGFDLDTTAHPNVVAMQAREANIEGEGAISMAALFRNALRMVPSRVFVGEVRGDEVIPLLNAMSQGNDGSLSTVHASSSAGVFRKLVLYAAQSPERLDAETTTMHIAEGVHLVIHLRLTPDGNRYVGSVREVVDADGPQVISNEIFRPGPDGHAVPGAPPTTQLVEMLAYHGFDPALLQRPQGWWDQTPRQP